MKRVYLPLLSAALVLPASGQIPAFKHIVVIVQENRSTDNMFQGLCRPPYGTAASCSTTPSASQYDIQTSNWLDKTSPTGVTQPTADPLATKYDPDHTHTAFLAMCDAPAGSTVCAMDGAALIRCTIFGGEPVCPPRSQLTYVDNSTGILNPYLDMATQYGFANYMFQTNQGQSLPAHQILFGGTSAPSASDDALGIFAAENDKYRVNSGCVAPSDSKIELVTPAGELPGNAIYPCFEHATIADVLPSVYSWRYYSPSGPSALWAAPDAIAHLCQSSGFGGTCKGPDYNVSTAPTAVLTDIAACKLRSVNWVTPTGQNSDHPAINDGGGPSWVAAIVNAIGNSNTCDGGEGYWQDTAIIVLWDDWGGFYDHVRPTILPGVEGDYQYGFRVPMIFISAYTSAGFIGQKRLDFGSVLRFIEHNFGISEGVLQFADERASTNLTDFYRLSLAPRTFKTISAPIPAAFFLKDTRTPLPADTDGDGHDPN